MGFMSSWTIFQLYHDKVHLLMCFLGITSTRLELWSTCLPKDITTWPAARGEGLEPATIDISRSSHEKEFCGNGLMEIGFNWQWLKETFLVTGSPEKGCFYCCYKWIWLRFHLRFVTRDLSIAHCRIDLPVLERCTPSIQRCFFFSFLATRITSGQRARLMWDRVCLKASDSDLRRHRSTISTRSCWINSRKRCKSASMAQAAYWGLYSSSNLCWMSLEPINTTTFSASQQVFMNIDQS